MAALNFIPSEHGTPNKLWAPQADAHCFILSGESVVTKKGDSALTVDFKVMDGINLGREHKEYFMQTCSSYPQAVEFALQKLAALCIACKVDVLNEPYELNGKQFLCNIGVKFDKKKGENVNTFDFVESASGAPVASAPSAAAMPQAQYATRAQVPGATQSASPRAAWSVPPASQQQPSGNPLSYVSPEDDIPF